MVKKSHTGNSLSSVLYSAYELSHGTFTVQSSVTTSFISDIPAKTRHVLYNIIKNIIKKNSRNPYLNQLLFIHAGISILREIPNLPPIRLKSCPLPQNLFQYNLFPPTTANISGAKKAYQPYPGDWISLLHENNKLSYSTHMQHILKYQFQLFLSLLYHLNLRNI